MCEVACMCEVAHRKGSVSGELVHMELAEGGWGPGEVGEIQGSLWWIWLFRWRAADLGYKEGTLGRMNGNGIYNRAYLRYPVFRDVFEACAYSTVQYDSTSFRVNIHTDT
jgi:hypothetical protein